MEAITEPYFNILIHKQLDLAQSCNLWWMLATNLGTLSYFLEYFSLEGRRKNFCCSRALRGKQHSGAAPLYTNEDLGLEEKSFMVLESKRYPPTTVQRTYVHDKADYCGQLATTRQKLH